MQLNVLARRQVGVAVAEHGAVVGSLGEGVGRHPDLAHLRGRHHAPGHLDPHHERVAALSLRIQTDPLQALGLARDFGDGLRPPLRVRVDDRLGHLEGMARELELLDRVELADRPVGPDELQAPVTPSPEFDAIGIVQVPRH